MVAQRRVFWFSIRNYISWTFFEIKTTKKKYVAEYDEDYNGEDLEMSGVNIERGKFIINLLCSWVCVKVCSSFNSKSELQILKIQIVEYLLFEALFEEHVRPVNPR